MPLSILSMHKNSIWIHKEIKTLLMVHDTIISFSYTFFFLFKCLNMNFKWDNYIFRLFSFATECASVLLFGRICVCFCFSYFQSICWDSVMWSVLRIITAVLKLCHSEFKMWWKNEKESIWKQFYNFNIDDGFDSILLLFLCM